MSHEWRDCHLNLFRWQMTKFRRQQAQQGVCSFCPVDQKVRLEAFWSFWSKIKQKWTNIHDYSHLLIDQVTVQTRQIQTRQIIGQSPTIVYSVYSHKKMYWVHNISLYVHIFCTLFMWVDNICALQYIMIFFSARIISRTKHFMWKLNK